MLYRILITEQSIDYKNQNLEQSYLIMPRPDPSKKKAVVNPLGGRPKDPVQYLKFTTINPKEKVATCNACMVI